MVIDIWKLNRNILIIYVVGITCLCYDMGCYVFTCVDKWYYKCMLHTYYTYYDLTDAIFL